MKLKIDFELPNANETLMIALIDNPGVAAWAEHCRNMTSSRLTTKQPVAATYQTPITKNSKDWAQLQLVQASLAPTKLPMPMTVDAPEQITRQHLNVWHRWFTSHTKTLVNSTPEWAEEFHWLHELNQIVHRIEGANWEWPKEELGHVGTDLNFPPELNQHGGGIAFLDLTPYRQYHSWEYADVILDQAVHGKTTMQSFIDNDDPKDWDTTGHHISWGGCKLVNGPYRRDIYQGALFDQWMTRNNVTRDELWGDYPLGNIINRDQAQLDRLFGYQENEFLSVNITILD